MQTKWVRGADGALILPEYMEETARHEAEVTLMVALHDELESYNKELRQIDPDLQLVWAPESATNPALVPGRFHILRRNPPPSPPLLLPLQDDRGNFREPGSWMYDMLRSADLWNDRAQEDRRKAQEEITRQKESRRRAEREELAEEIDLRLKAKNNPGFLFSDVPWSYRSEG